MEIIDGRSGSSNIIIAYREPYCWFVQTAGLQRILSSPVINAAVRYAGAEISTREMMSPSIVHWCRTVFTGDEQFRVCLRAPMGRWRQQRAERRSIYLSTRPFSSRPAADVRAFHRFAYAVPANTSSPELGPA